MTDFIIVTNNKQGAVVVCRLSRFSTDSISKCNFTWLRLVSDYGFMSLFWHTLYQHIFAGLEIISEESPDTMTGQVHFSSVTYRF